MTINKDRYIHTNKYIYIYNKYPVLCAYKLYLKKKYEEVTIINL